MDEMLPVVSEYAIEYEMGFPNSWNTRNGGTVRKYECTHTVPPFRDTLKVGMTVSQYLQNDYTELRNGYTKPRNDYTSNRCSAAMYSRSAVLYSI